MPSEPRMREVLAIIPARANSRRLRNKNILSFCGRPLVEWSIKSAIESRYVSRIVVSSDSEQVLAMASALGVEGLKRPARLATEIASSESVVDHVLENLRTATGYTPKAIILLQPTSPQRTAADVDQAILDFKNSAATSLVSGFEPVKTPLKDFFILGSGLVVNIRNYMVETDSGVDPLRIFRPNGAIFLTEYNAFKRKGKLISDHCMPFYMDPRKSIDIDNEKDFEEAEREMGLSYTERGSVD